MENSRSWVFITSRAICAEETTRVGTWPSWRSIRGPCFWESSRRERWGRGPMWCRWPMMGSLEGGLGGRLEGGDGLFLLRFTRKRGRSRERRIGRKESHTAAVGDKVEKRDMAKGL